MAPLHLLLATLLLAPQAALADQEMLLKMAHKMAGLEARLAELETTNEELRRQVAEPAAFMFTCATRDSFPGTRNVTVTFDYLTADFSSAGLGEGLEAATGLFTALTSGVYEVTFSAVSVLQGTEESESASDQYFYLMHNAESAGNQGEWWSRADAANVGDIYDMGARTVVGRLCSCGP